MKKSKIFLLLLTLCLAATSLIGGTIAKYATSDSANDSAQVAKWGVELKVNGDLYGESYAKYGEASSNKPVADSSAEEISVSYNGNGTNLVAPGTKSDTTGIQISLTGTAEVMMNVTTTVRIENVFLKAGTYGIMVQDTTINEENFGQFKANLYYLDGSTYKSAASVASFAQYPAYYYIQNQVTTADYFPVVYKMDGVATTSSADSLVAIAKALTNNATLSDGAYTYSQQIPANADMPTILSNKNVTWEWAIGESTNADTILGKLQANNETVVIQNGADFDVISATDGMVTYNSNTIANLKTSFYITIAVEQVD